ncbi:winged helix family two component transcriptional regulator [Aliiruegeria haliotis]|uniref:Regulatory protein VirG n=1 Tax=Aliiruegeria haliotis TaxID=1280846 RepID=A0A2T0RYY7_9RHOB|nr:response regulator [Aliiruegeria haliotis]PRY26391.1 winged helix family two component transcriptional regulator [Aliiruegeria haliotis]
MTDTSDPTILVCDDETDLCEMLGEYLGKRGFAVISAHDAVQMRERLSEADVDLILLDVNMPGEDGLTALRTLRVEDRTPVIMLTAAGETIDRIVGLEMGADDYLGKPVDLRELEARIKAVLRRAPTQAEAPVAENGRTSVPFGTFTLDFDAAKLFRESGEEVPLTAMEFRLLKLFAENRSRVLNRDQILEQAHDRSWDPFDRSIDIRISRLRRKIEANPQKPSLIRTVRGIGYVFDPE